MINHVIPAEAVEAAAKVLLQITYPHDAEWDGWDEPGHVRLRMEARTILEAAAPHMLKAAYDLGLQHGANQPPNPYRKEDR